MKYLGNGRELLEDFLARQMFPIEKLKAELVHPSSAQAPRINGVSQFQRLEFVGDAALGLAVAQILYLQMPDASEGRLTAARSQVVRGVNLAKMARWLGIREMLQLGEGEDSDNESILADSCEVLFGLIVLRCGYSAAIELVQDILDHSELSSAMAIPHPKTAIKELAERRHLPLAFAIVSREGLEHQPVFTAEVRLGEYCARAAAGSIKEAEKLAASEILQEIGDGNSD